MAEKMTPVQALRVYFEAEGGRKLGLTELQQLSAEERRELAVLVAKELGVELTEPERK